MLRGGEIGNESRKTNIVHAAICEGCGRMGRVGSDVEDWRKLDSDQRLRWKCG